MTKRSVAGHINDLFFKSFDCVARRHQFCIRAAQGQEDAVRPPGEVPGRVLTTQCAFAEYSQIIAFRPLEKVENDRLEMDSRVEAQRHQTAGKQMPGRGEETKLSAMAEERANLKSIAAEREAHLEASQIAAKAKESEAELSARGAALKSFRRVMAEGKANQEKAVFCKMLQRGAQLETLLQAAKGSEAKLGAIITAMTEEKASLETAAAQRNIQLEALQKAAEEKEAELSAMSEEKASLGAVAAERKAQLEVVQKAAEEKEAELSAMAEEKASLEAVAAERKAQLEASQRAVADNEAKLSAMEKENAKQEKAAEFWEMLEHKAEVQLEALQRAVKEMEAKLSAMAEEKANLESRSISSRPELPVSAVGPGGVYVVQTADGPDLWQNSCAQPIQCSPFPVMCADPTATNVKGESRKRKASDYF